MKQRVLVVIPTAKGNKEKGMLTAKIMEERAGVQCTVIVVEDVEEKGWVAIHNEMVKKFWNDYDFYLYGCDDYYPGNHYLRKALIAIVTKNVGLLAFNDGKWDGNNATVGLVDKNIIPELYTNNDLFYSGYKMHGADPDLTARAKQLNSYYYCQEAILMEIDYNKDLRNIHFEEGNKDHELFQKRREQGFPRK